MAETLLILAIQKIAFALANGAAHHASPQFGKYTTQLKMLQGSLRRVVSELRVIHGFLCQMDIRNRSNEVYEIWLEEVQRAVHSMEDTVDEYLYLVRPEHVGSCFYLKKGFSNKKSRLSLKSISSRVKETEKDLANLFQAKDRWVSMINNGETSNSNYIIQRSQELATDSRTLAEEDLVGIEHNKQKLVQWLEYDDLPRSIIVLHGMGGLGKTALACTVYKKEHEKFGCHAWISISQTSNREDVLRKLIAELLKDNQIVPCNIDIMDLSTIQQTLKKLLQSKKYLIILDDVWTPHACTELLAVLTTKLKGSRIIITTRNADVAYLASQDRVVTLEPLSEDESWELFCKKAFQSHECPEELKHLSKQIVDKCEGLPLAVVSISGLLFVRDKSVVEWKRIHDQLSWELVNNTRLDQLRNVLHLSFIYLPTYLKSCLLHCSLFPEDFLFQRKKLIRLWVAEGFIEERAESILEEVAEVYLKELIHRNMLQLVERNSFGRIKIFRMHDILRELALDLCRKYCFGVTYEEVKYRGSLEKDGRRLVVHKSNKDIQQSVSSIHHLRTLITLTNSMPSFAVLPLLCKSRYMSVLELSGLPIENIPDAIGDLFNLRHLGLRGSKVKMLPKSIEKLSNLLTLDLWRSDIQELPGGIVKLKKLRHLFAERMNGHYGRVFRCTSGVCIPKGIENLTNLQTLQALEATDESLKNLGDMRELRSFRIHNVKEIHCARLSESLVQMRFLSYLDVTASDENEVLWLNSVLPNLQKLRLSGQLAEGTLEKSRLFQAVAHNLYSLDLSWSQLREDPLSTLSRLSKLTQLNFTRAYNGERLVFLAGWFSILKTLVLGDLPNLRWLEVHEGALMTLEKIELINLRSMTEVPLGIEFLLSVKHVGFAEITWEFLMLLRQCPRTDRIRWGYTLRC